MWCVCVYHFALNWLHFAKFGVPYWVLVMPLESVLKSVLISCTYFLSTVSAAYNLEIKTTVKPATIHYLKHKFFVKALLLSIVT